MSGNAPDVRSQILSHLAQGVEKARQSWDAKSGRFLAANGGWAVTHQDIIFPLALLYVTPGTPCHHDRRILNLCLRGGDALCDAQNREGRFEFIKVDGSRWGWVYQPWTIYHWVEALVLLEPHLEPQRRRRWKTGLGRAYQGLAKELKNPRPHNIPTWNGMSLVRAAQVFNEPHWQHIGSGQISFAVEHQHPHGYWPEGDGPTTSYNLVYVHALGLYHAFTRDRSVLAALRRAAAFHATFTYPDGSLVETVDGRVKYHPRTFITGWPGLALHPQGRSLVRLAMQSLGKQKSPSLVPHLASAWQHWTDGTEAPLPMHQPRQRTVFKRSALVRTHGPWFLCVSGYVPGSERRPGLSRNRWIMTRANALSVWHEKLGLLIGGGNSKHDPYFATFEVWQDSVGRIEPDKVGFACLGQRDTARFHYGDLSCLLHLRPLDYRRLEIVFELPARTARRGSVRAGFSLRLAAESKLSWTTSEGSQHTTELDPLRTVYAAWPEGKSPAGVLRGPGWRLRVPSECTMEYPAYPFNPYAINDASEPANASACVMVKFEHGCKKKFLLDVGS